MIKSRLAKGSNFFAIRIISDNEVSVNIMCSYIYAGFYISIQLRQMFDECISPTMYECFMNTKYRCACLQKIWYKVAPSARLD